ncbi:MAG: hypothetical protein M1822_005944 [Bathelium mastoideum]|nr:MAG: hypothetical protein M1822_005944 [Bathelium mastoideum]
MGWWYRADPQTPVLKSSDSTPDPVPTSSEPPASAREVADIPTRASPSSSPTRDEQADAELRSFLAELSQATPSDQTSTSTSTSSASSANANAPPRPTTTSPFPPSEDSLYPSTMSCRAAFDAAFYCQSLGGQVTNVYRYGGLRDCGVPWADFRFCMRTKTESSEEARRAAIREHYRKKEVVWKMGPSSEDVWEVRREPLVGAFGKDPGLVG